MQPIMLNNIDMKSLYLLLAGLACLVSAGLAIVNCGLLIYLSVKKGK
jgi:hypothetical protein